MGKITITKRFEFCYGHHLPGYSGKCVNAHGHNSTLEIEIDNHHNVTTYPGMVMDFGDLKKIVKEQIIDYLDHKDLNTLTEFQNQPPTAENIVEMIVGILTNAFSPLQYCLVRVRVYETPDSYAEWNA
ncbi:MAG: 6-carboxytetrahydropterin synthase [Bacilli bacterium]|nr:6-carboxytetrahydropterin synthase [Bacilli bacterium]